MPGLVIGGAELRPSAGDLRAGRADALGPAQRREERASASSTPRARSAAPELLEAEAAVLPRPRHLHLLRHRQLQPDADGDHGPAPAGRQLRQPEHAAARCADRASPPARAPRSPRSATSTRRSARSSTSAPSSTASSACTRPAARPTTRCTSSPWRARPGIQLTWDDFADLSDVVPLLCRVYPNGLADVNHFHAAGGMAFLIGAAARCGPAARGRAHGRRRRRARRAIATSRSSRAAALVWRRAAAPASIPTSWRRSTSRSAPMAG